MQLFSHGPELLDDLRIPFRDGVSFVGLNFFPEFCWPNRRPVKTTTSLPEHLTPSPLTRPGGTFSCQGTENSSLFPSFCRLAAVIFLSSQALTIRINLKVKVFPFAYISYVFPNVIRGYRDKVTPKLKIPGTGLPSIRLTGSYVIVE
ncbi:Ornithine decarboxylase antizyme 1 [Sesbania bispinosa]|nr:Ornithine decarboxylase antizyme 1 [Sesbania bispinosa]